MNSKLSQSCSFTPNNVAGLILDEFFAGDGRTPVTSSIRECYIDITGDEKVTGRVADCDRARFREALGLSSWQDALGNALQRAMVREYRENPHYAVWRKIVSVSNVGNFRTQHRTRIGGYGDLSAVAEGGNYLPLVSPGDESSSFAVSKRGGIETISLEMIRSDNINAVRNVPKRLAAAAVRTLSRFVLNLLRDNAAIYDGKALFHADHGNLGGAPLSAVSLAAARAAMRRQREPDSGDVLGIEPRYLLVPFDLEEAAVNLFRRDGNLDRTAQQSSGIEVLPVWCWEDEADWCLMADPMQCTCIEMGFLDGQEEPDLFLQDSPHAGSLFSNDQLRYKIRHIYGGVSTAI